MSIFFKTLYIYISNLGLLCLDLFKGFFRLLFKAIKGIFRFNRNSFSSMKIFLKRSAVFLLVAAILVTGVGYLVLNDSRATAVAISANGEIVGFAQSQSEADHASALALTALGMTEGDITTEETKTEPYNIKSAQHISELLIKTLAPELTEVYEIYIDGEFFCATTDKQASKEVFAKLLQKAQKKYPKSVVSFAEEIAFKRAYYSPSDTRIWNAEQIRIMSNSGDLLTIQHAECEKKISTVEFDTVEIQTNTLFIGDKRIRRNGANGSEYAVDLVTYRGDKKVQSEHLMSVAVQNPVSQIVERGIRAESLSLGTYSVLQTTGYFCWPVVSLFTVTSPFGYRSLGYHRGIDISGASASGALIVAGAAGTVTEAGWSTGGYGNYVKIDHGNGVETLYAHMLDNSIMVNPGDRVTKGQAIGRVGNTGYSFGAHLHFEVRINGNRINPAPYLGLE